MLDCRLREPCAVRAGLYCVVGAVRLVFAELAGLPARPVLSTGRNSGTFTTESPGVEAPLDCGRERRVAHRPCDVSAVLRSVIGVSYSLKKVRINGPRPQGIGSALG